MSETERRALELQTELSRIDRSDAAAREALLLRMASECPGTEEAEFAFWALADLYLSDFPDPRPEKAQAVLERFLEVYPGSRWKTHAENRLVLLYQGTESAGKALPHCSALLKEGDLPKSFLPFVALSRAQIIEETRGGKEAFKAYEGVRKHYPGTAAARRAEARLSVLKGRAKPAVEKKKTGEQKKAAARKKSQAR